MAPKSGRLGAGLFDTLALPEADKVQICKRRFHRPTSQAGRVRMRLPRYRCGDLWNASPRAFAKLTCNPLDKARFFIEPGDVQRRVGLGVADSEIGSVLDEQGERLRAGVTLDGIMG